MKVILTAMAGVLRGEMDVDQEKTQPEIRLIQPGLPQLQFVFAWDHYDFDHKKEVYRLSECYTQYQTS